MSNRHSIASFTNFSLSDSNNTHWAFQLWQAVQKTLRNNHFLPEASSRMKTSGKFFSSEPWFYFWTIFLYYCERKNVLNSSIIRELCILSEYVVLKNLSLEILFINLNSRVISNERQIPYDVTYGWNLKYSTNEPIDETKTDSQI